MAKRTTKSNSQPSQGLFEKLFENILWNTRFATLLAVVFGIFSAIAVFLVGSYDIYKAIKMLVDKQQLNGTHLVASVIGGIDMFLIGVVLMIFSFGIYELFISPIDVGRKNKDLKLLEIASLDELKNKIIKVVLMVLVVTFFKKVLDTNFKTPLEMLYFALSICAISFGVYFMNKSQGK